MAFPNRGKVEGLWTMSLFKNLASSARAAHDVYFGDTVELLESGVTSSPRVVLGPEQVQTREIDGDEHRVRTRACRFVSLTSVRHDALVTIDGVTWQIESVGNRTASGLNCTLVHSQAHAVQRPGYRRGAFR